MADFDWGGLASQLANLYGQYQGTRTANNVANQVGNYTGAQQIGYQSQLNNLMSQIQASQAAAAQQYAQAQADYGTQNQGLQGNIDYLNTVLTGLSDPNSVYMQGQKNQLERSDAAAGRRNNLSDRDVSLQGKLAQYIAQYSPGIQNSITAARNQIASNNNSLANIFNTMNMSADRNNIAIGNLLNGMNSAAQTANTTGRQAQNSATNNTTGMLNSLFGLGGHILNGVGGLSGLFGSNGYSEANQGGLDNLISSNNGWGTMDSGNWGTGYDYGNEDYGSYF